MVAEVDAQTLAALEAALLNTSGSVPLHNRFRALFTLKALKNDTAVQIISKGPSSWILVRGTRREGLTGACRLRRRERTTQT